MEENDLEKEFQNDIESDINEEEVIYADFNDSLMIRQTLVVEQDTEEDWFRSSIFRTKCTINGNVCSMIIDGGGYRNMLSKRAVDKLKLKTEKVTPTL